jgi:hypothetical protein
MSESGSDSIASFLKEHPRLMGAVFTALLLLSQAGSVAATGGATSGP